VGKRSDFERIPKDLYVTPPDAVVPLLPYLAPETEFGEPCAGNGALVDILEREGHKCVWASDISPGRSDIGVLNALALPRLGLRNVHARVWVTNPPWKRSVLHPLIDGLSSMLPTWLLFDADWPHTRQSADLIGRCARIIPVGRIKWIPDSEHVGKDNCCWYEFLPGHTDGPHFMPRVPKALMGPEERRRAAIKASGRLAEPGPLFGCHSATNGHLAPESFGATHTPTSETDAPQAAPANLGPSSRELLARLRGNMRKLPVPRITGN
jgi:hypothetical protein